MKYLITNLQKDSPQLKKINYDNVIFFNPWGFSKKQLAADLLMKLIAFKPNADDEVFVIMKNAFFGRRVKFIFELLKKNNIIFNVKSYSKLTE